MTGTRSLAETIVCALAACSLSLAVAQAQGRPGDVVAPDGWGASTEVRPAVPPPPRKRAATERARSPEARAETGQSKATPPVRRTASGVVVQRPPSRLSKSIPNAVLGYAIDGDRARTVIRFDLGGPTEVHARSLAKPPRVIVDLPETEFRLPPASGRAGRGLVTAFRFGLIEAGKSRIVLDTAEPARVASAEVVLGEAGGAFRLEIELVPTTERELAAIELAEAALTFRPAVPEPQTAIRPALPERPVVVVDAGHGGIDTGASGSRVAEKDLVLAVAREVERALRSTTRYEVVMTRTRDVFVSLDERVAISRRHNADLFISLHADSLPDREGSKAIRGATVYTLAEQASDDLTRRVAESENSVDLLAGFPVSLAGDDQVRDILLDLMRRETHIFASEFRQLLLGALGSSVLLSRDPNRSGPFKVLRQASSPAVLVELGYISNAEDERIMQQPAWQAKVAAAVMRAVGEHFRQRRAGTR